MMKKKLANKRLARLKGCPAMVVTSVVGFQRCYNPDRDLRRIEGPVG
jgi:hypothetical protein